MLNDGECGFGEAGAKRDRFVTWLHGRGGCSLIRSLENRRRPELAAKRSKGVRTAVFKHSDAAIFRLYSEKIAFIRLILWAVGRIGRFAPSGQADGSSQNGPKVVRKAAFRPPLPAIARLVRLCPPCPPLPAFLWVGSPSAECEFGLRNCETRTAAFHRLPPLGAAWRRLAAGAVQEKPQ